MREGNLGLGRPSKPRSLPEGIGWYAPAIWPKKSFLITAFAFCLNAMPSPSYEPLLREAIVHHLGPRVAAILDLEIRERCGSSNSELLAAPSGPSDRLCALAVEHQTAGRGRRGRSWQSWPGGSLTFSLRAESLPGPLSGLSLAAGVALGRALERHAQQPIQLKWPNDLWIDGRKLGGILVELAASAVVIGVGLNLLLPPEGLGADETQQAAALFDHPPVARNHLLADCLHALSDMLHTFSQQGFQAFHAAWNDRNAHAGREVMLLGEGRTPAGRCLGVDESGALLLATPAGIERVLSGDLSLRPRP
jgi:BirA family biotin operon repressor/biotin-[acetyl-CoA-carboxylase] ligase